MVLANLWTINLQLALAMVCLQGPTCSNLTLGVRSRAFVLQMVLELHPFVRVCSSSAPCKCVDWLRHAMMVCLLPDRHGEWHLCKAPADMQPAELSYGGQQTMRLWLLKASTMSVRLAAPIAVASYCLWRAVRWCGCFTLVCIREAHGHRRRAQLRQLPQNGSRQPQAQSRTEQMLQSYTLLGKTQCAPTWMGHQERVLVSYTFASRVI